MEKITLPNGATVNIPSTARDWELYSSMVESSEAAYELTKALKAAFLEINTTPWTKVYNSMKSHLYPVMEQYSKCGAWDSEPRYQAENALEQYRQALFGDE